ncbi:hypothetical protein ACFL6B_05185 [Thermodesulfobacteriota bacterium]
MSMWIYDDHSENEHFQNLREEVKLIEREYLELRVLLRDAETDLRSDPDSEYLNAKVTYLTKRVKDLEKKAPRFAADYPLEIALFGPPHG